MSAIFVTGSGTDVGKTYVTCALLRHLRARRVAVDASKPVVSGFSADDAAQSDSGKLLLALGRDVTRAALDRLSPWQFRAPLSPDIAAAREGRSIDFAALVAHGRELARATSAGLLAIEGVGGVRVPLDATHTVADWIDALDLPVVLVGGTALGEISHTLCALDVLLARGRRVAAIAASESQDPAVPLGEHVAVLRRFIAGVAVVGMPRGAGPDDEGVAELAALVS